jgi:hypothetical protein
MVVITAKAKTTMTFLKTTFLLVFLSVNLLVNAQTAEDLFKTNDTKIRWLGIDFTHVNLIGKFSNFTGDKSSWEIKHIYFPAWNRMILDERDRYDIRGMLRKDVIYYDIDMIAKVNDGAPLEDLESYNTPQYTESDITNFVNSYNTEGMNGIGIALIAETLNKAENESYFHFVAINLANKQVLIHQRLRGEPRGLGFKNYWAGAIHDVLQQIDENYYRLWRSEYAKR